MRLSQRIVMRNAIMAARRCAPKDVRDALTFCQRPTSRSRVFSVRSSETQRLNAFVSHLTTCKLAWACPVCGASHAFRKQEEVHRSILGWQALGIESSSDNRAALLTFTVSHDRTRSLADLLPVVLRAFTLTMNSHFARKCRANGVYFGWARAVEITWNPQTG